MYIFFICTHIYICIFCDAASPCHVGAAARHLGSFHPMHMNIASHIG